VIGTAKRIARQRLPIWRDPPAPRTLLELNEGRAGLGSSSRNGENVRQAGKRGRMTVGTGGRIFKLDD